MKFGIKISKKIKILGAISGLFLVLAALIALGLAINEWYNTYYFQFNKPVEIKFNKPIEIKKRESQPQETVRVVEIEKVPEHDEEYKKMNDIEKYICDKWGVYDCKIAIAIAKAESGLKEDAINVYNSNGTVDVGIFQINSVHFSKPGCSLKEVVDAKKNIDCAYEIYQSSGWSAWAVWKSGAFKEKL